MVWHKKRRRSPARTDRRLGLLLLFLVCAGGWAAPPPPLRLGATTTVEQAGALLGRWEYVSGPASKRAAPGLNAGLQLSLEIDSAVGKRFSGRVARWFSGDVGVRTGNFGRVTGQISGAVVRLTIPFARSNAAPIVIEARRVASDTLRIVTASRGAEPGPFGAGAMLVRRRRGPARAPR